MSDTPRDCAHGALARSCDRCADAREIAELKAEVERLRSTPRASPPPTAISALMSGPLIDSLSSRHTYTEAEVRLVMAGMRAEIDAAHAEIERITEAGRAHIRRADQFERERDAARARAETTGRDWVAALDLVSRIREALGDHSLRMQPELIEYARGLNQIARGELVHRDAGDCPDEMHPQQRDPQCPACRVIW